MEACGVVVIARTVAPAIPQAQRTVVMDHQADIRRLAKTRVL